ncbi:MAG TPA: DUF2244 domain-containing protein [Stellaceae bacterium]|nr:DUF2244 domain-containing protein [Stellaceae bacterium]
MSEAEAEGGHVFLDAVLYPYRSLKPKGFVILMLALAGLSLLAGTICILVGAWPVFGFFGLDVLLVYIAFRLSYRSARQHEAVRLTEKSLTVERVSVKGERRQFRFEPTWLRISFDDAAERSPLTLASHGKSLVVGGFLAPEERRSFAGQLRRAITAWRAFVTGNPAQ